MRLVRSAFPASTLLQLHPAYVRLRGASAPTSTEPPLGLSSQRSHGPCCSTRLGARAPSSRPPRRRPPPTLRACRAPRGDRAPRRKGPTTREVKPETGGGGLAGAVGRMGQDRSRHLFLGSTGAARMEHQHHVSPSRPTATALKGRGGRPTGADASATAAGAPPRHRPVPVRGRHEPRELNDPARCSGGGLRSLGGSGRGGSAEHGDWQPERRCRLEYVRVGVALVPRAMWAHTQKAKQ